MSDVWKRAALQRWTGRFAGPPGCQHSQRAGRQQGSKPADQQTSKPANQLSSELYADRPGSKVFAQTIGELHALYVRSELDRRRMLCCGSRAQAVGEHGGGRRRRRRVAAVEAGGHGPSLPGIYRRFRGGGSRLVSSRSVCQSPRRDSTSPIKSTPCSGPPRQLRAPSCVSAFATRITTRSWRATGSWPMARALRRAAGCSG